MCIFTMDIEFIFNIPTVGIYVMGIIITRVAIMPIRVSAVCTPCDGKPFMHEDIATDIINIMVVRINEEDMADVKELFRLTFACLVELESQGE